MNSCVASRPISRERLCSKIGRQLDVLVDTVDAEGALARSYGDAPEIVGLVHISGAAAVALSVGDRIWVVVERADDYDLYAIVDEAV